MLAVLGHLSHLEINLFLYSVNHPSIAVFIQDILEEHVYQSYELVPTV